MLLTEFYHSNARTLLVFEQNVFLYLNSSENRKVTGAMREVDYVKYSQKIGSLALTYLHGLVACNGLICLLIRKWSRSQVFIRGITYMNALPVVICSGRH